MNIFINNIERRPKRKTRKNREKIVVNQKLAFYINNGLMYSYPHIVVKYEDDINTQLPIPAV